MADIGKHKYQRIKEYIIDTIRVRELKSGEKIFSENELVDKFGISRHTVRQAIGELVSEGWLYRVQGKGTFVGNGSAEKAGHSRTIGVITTYLNDYIFPAIIRGIDSVLLRNGYNILLGCTYNQHQKERLCIENISNQNIAGLIAEPTKSALPNPNLHLYRELNNRGIPILFIHGCYKDLNYSYIVVDDTQAGYMATRHLIESGHKRIGGVFKIDDIQGHYRFAGFQKAHIDAGLQLSGSRVIWFNTDEAETIFNDKTIKQLSGFFSACSAIVCYNDQIAIKILDVLRKLSLSIPENLSIVSFDDSQLAVVSEVKLTSIAHPKEKLGQEAARTIINLINKKQCYYKIKMQPELVVRESIKKN